MVASRSARILVVDDQPAIHHDFARVLAAAGSAAIDVLEAELLGRPVEPPRYVLAGADQGLRAVELVREAVARDERFDLAFVDARMPPGIDGIETVRRLWEVDDTLHVVLCTAYADYQWDDIERAIGITDQFLILKKPFDPLEVRQLAAALTQKARLVRAQRSHVAQLADLVEARTRELQGAVEALRVEGEQRADAERLAARAQQMQALGRLTAGIAHEINNPLQVVRGHLEMLDDELDRRGMDDLLRRLRVAISSTDRIAAIVGEVRLFATPQETVGQPVDVEKVVDGALTLLARSTPPRVEISLSADRVGPVLAIEHRLAQVIVNVLENAFAAFGAVADRPHRIAIRLASAGPGEVLVEVADTGEGIPPEHLAKVFEPFFTTRAIGRGSGLGLSICKGIVESFGGRIEIASQRGVGTTVRISLPRAPALPTVDAPAPVALSRAGLEILVIDDEEPVRRLVGMMLGRHRPVACGSVREALALVAETPFDVILCDVTMPERTGLELLDDLRRSSPAIAERVILMSGAVLGEDARAARAARPGRWLDKPFSRRQLEEAIASVVGADPGA